MPADNTVTITAGNIGPGIAVANLEIPMVSNLNFDFIAQVVTVITPDGNYKQIQFSNIDTVTFAFPNGEGGRVTVAIEEA